MKLFYGAPRRFVRPALGLAALATVLVTSGCAAWRIGQSVEMARQSQPLQRTPEAAALRLLIVGDSTGVGTGASSPETSVAGLLARAYPKLAIENRSRDGAKFAGLVEQLDAGPADARYDMILVQAGGNDVIRLRDLEAMRADIDRVVKRARELSPLVVLQPAGNVGNAPFFFAPISWWMGARSRDMHRLVRAAAASHGAIYVSLFQERENDPFVRQPGLNARDGLHPSDAGYELWFRELQTQAGLAERLASARASAAP